MSFNFLPRAGSLVSHMKARGTGAEADLAQIVGDLQVNRPFARQRPALSARPRWLRPAATPRSGASRISTGPGRASHRSSPPGAGGAPGAGVGGTVA
jgi:hypothetical protein